MQNVTSNVVGTITTENTVNGDVDNTTTTGSIPAVGKQIVIDVICIISIVILIVAMIRAEKYKGI